MASVLQTVGGHCRILSIHRLAMTFDERLRVVFASVLGIDASTLTDDDTSQTITAWDSLAHLNLIFALEAEFGVRFEAEEIPDLMSVDAVRRRITREIDGAQYV